jgi:hypothetical protein
MKHDVSDEVNFPEFIQMLKGCMNFDRWGFKQTFYGTTTDFSPSVIYSSEKCRVMFLWHKGDVRDGYATITIRYARLHATVNHKFMLWNGQKFHCWHYVDLALSFLDDLSPHEAVEKQSKWPNVMQQFIELNKKQNFSQVEWKARMHAFVWEHYGNRLFDLFDLRRPDLWEQYKLFVREYYRLDPGVFNPNSPPPENIC